MPQKKGWNRLYHNSRNGNSYVLGLSESKCDQCFTVSKDWIEKIDMCPKIVVIYNLSLLKVDYFVDVVFQIVKLP